MPGKTGYLLERVLEQELNLCLWANRASRHRWVVNSFAFISWLGDGKFWYILMAVLPLYYGTEAIPVSLRMLLAGGIGLLIYKSIKSATVRVRPYLRSASIKLGTAPLDQYSFPSGHTLHAVTFTTIAGFYYPGLLWILAPFTVLIAISRVLLGLHYPTDVLMGAAIGATLAACAILL